MRMRSDFTHNSAVIFCMISCGRNLGRNSVQIYAKNGKAQQVRTYVRSYVQCLYVHSQRTGLGDLDLSNPSSTHNLSLCHPNR